MSSAHQVHVPHECLVPVEVSKGHPFPVTGVTDGCESPYECQELNLGPLQEHQALQTTELSLQPCNLFIFSV